MKTSTSIHSLLFSAISAMTLLAGPAAGQADKSNIL
jgi:hypothetical protein